MQGLLATAVWALALVALSVRAEIRSPDAPSYDSRWPHPDDLQNKFGGNCTLLRAQIFHLDSAGVRSLAGELGTAVRCDPDGSYAARQVVTEPNTGAETYTCLTKHGKRLIAGPHIESCACPRVKYDGMERAKTSIGGYVPSCNDTTGYWSSQQFHPSTGMRWCANKHTGGVIGEETRGELVGC